MVSMINQRAYWAEWADGLLGAAAGGDDEAARMYPIANWLSLGGEVTDTDMEAIKKYIKWFESKNVQE
jgi:hypothetical protein